MSKYNINWDEAKLKKFIKEGRGQGQGKNYKPWLTVQDYPSKGRCSRIMGWKTKRVHHFFSDSQTRYFYLLEWDESVIDIREQYPLLDFDETVEDNDDLRLDLFTEKNTLIPYVLSTTFLITYKNENGDILYKARSLKAASELSKKITLERLEDERRYWRSKAIDWRIVTDKDISVTKSKNIEWVHSAAYNYEDFSLTKDELNYLCSNFIDGIDNSTKSIRIFARAFDVKNSLKAGTGLFLFKYLIAVKEIKVDMNITINLNSNYKEIVKQ